MQSSWLSTVLAMCLFWAGGARAATQWSTMVNVTVCNAFPGSGMVTVTWGGITSPQLAYQSCATLLFNNGTTTGTAALYNGGALLQTANVAMLFEQTLCADGNRNQLVAYEDATGALAADLPLPVGCATLGAGQGEILFYNAHCALSSSRVDFWLTSGSTSEKVGSSLPCGAASYLSVPSDSGVIAGVLPQTGSGTVGTASLVAYANGTKNTVAGPFDVSSVVAPDGDGTVILVMSGDASHAAIAWSSAVNEPAPPTTTPTSTKPTSGTNATHTTAPGSPSAAPGLDPSFALISGLAMIAASGAFALFNQLL